MASGSLSPSGAAVDADKSVVKSVAKAFAVLQAFTTSQPELVLADVARAAKIDNATAHRFLNTLVGLGYVEKVAGSRRFRLTLKCLDLGFNAIARSDLRSLARPLLRSVVGPRIEAASIGVLDGGSIVYVERIQAGLARLAVDVRVGNRVAAFSTALGRAILSQMPVSEQRAVLESEAMQRLTSHTETEIEKVLERIAEARAHGYAVSDQETVAGLRVIAAPITDADGYPIAALSASAPAFGRTLDEFIGDARDQVCEAARKLSLALGAAGGTAGQRPTN